MRGLKDLNRSLSPVGYRVEKKKVVTYILTGTDGSIKEFETKNEMLKFVNGKGLKILQKEDSIRTIQY